MTVSRARFTLLTTATACAVASVGLIALQWTTPVPPIRSASLPEAAPTDDAVATAIPTFTDVWDKPLRQPLAVAPTAAPKPEPTLDLAFKLIGTVIEPDHSFAIFQVAPGQIEVRRVGETAGVAELISIGPRRVTIRYNGQTRELLLPDPVVIPGS